MKTSFILCAAPLSFLALQSACILGNGGGGSGAAGTSTASASAGGSGSQATGSSSSKGTGTGSSTGSGMGMPGWTELPLLDDATDPSNVVTRAGNDRVTGIHFTAPDSGIVATMGDEQTFGHGGAVYKASQKSLDKLLFSGNRNGLCLLGSIDFTGVEKTADGYVATAYACDVIASHDGGATFDIAKNGAGDTFGIESVLAMRVLPGRTVAAFGTSYISDTTSAPGPSSLWNDLWAPEGNPTFPNPIPAGECEEGPRGTVPTQRGRMYISPDGNQLAYVARQNGDATICVSHDGGKSFFPKAPTGLGPDAASLSPSGVVFATNQVGVAFWGNNIYPGQQWIAHTTDGGDTWSLATMPAQIANTEVEFESGFFAPDGQHGFIVGYDYTHSVALILRTSDSGVTWEVTGGDLAQKVSALGGGKLFTGFALDANHLWVGGEHGILMSNEAGGD